MKKFVTAIVSVIIVALATVPVFADEVISPEATRAAQSIRATSTVTVQNQDTSSTSPKTGYADSIPYVAIIISTLGCGVAAVSLAKSKAKNK